MAATMSLGQAAAAIGISKPGVIDAVKRQRLARRDDGDFDATAVAAYAENRRVPRGGETRRRPAVKSLSDAPVQASVDGDAARKARAALEVTLAPGGMYADRAAAELARDSYSARLKELEFRERQNKLLDAEKASRAIASANAKVRSSLLAIPAEKAPALHRLKTVAEVQDALREYIVEALEALCEDFARDS